MGNRNDVCVRMLQYIHQHYNSDLTLNQMGELLYMNPAYLGRLFKKEMGMSFSEYLISYRLKIAMNMLSQRNMLVSDIASAVGYNNMGYFYRIFRKEVGVSPLQYRNNQKNYTNPLYHVDNKALSADEDDANASGRIVYRIEMADSRSRGHAAVHRVYSDYLHLYYVYHENDKDILKCLISYDDGVTWKETDSVFAQTDDISGISVLNMLDGSMALFYKQDNQQNSLLMMRKSFDKGKTWGRAEVCFDLPPNYQLLDGHIIRLSSGSIIIPLSRPAIKTDPAGQHILCHYISDDDGTTWNVGQKSLAQTCRHTLSGLKYPLLLENKGIVFGWAASDLGYQYEFSSRDGGETWFQPQPSYFTSAEAPMDIAILKGGQWIAAINPIPPYLSSEQGHNCNRLVYLVSQDEGTKWSNAVLLEESDGRNNTRFWHPMIYPLDDHVLFIYQIASENGTSVRSEIVIRRVSLRTIRRRI